MHTIKDTKIVWSGNGLVYQICRTRKGILDTITLSYPVKNGLKSISRRIPVPLGYILQKFLEVTIDFV